MHVEGFYKDLFGREHRGEIELQADIWANKGSLSTEDRNIFEAKFTMDEVEKAVEEMKSNTTPGQMGPHRILQRIWNEVKTCLKEMMDKLYDGNLNISRLSYGLITLIPKMKETNNIRQFRPICLLNVSYKIVTKTLTNRLTRVADKVIDETQTTFIPGRYIL